MSSLSRSAQINPQVLRYTLHEAHTQRFLAHSATPCTKEAAICHCRRG